jgi:hypothetical protein
MLVSEVSSVVAVASVLAAASVSAAAGWNCCARPDASAAWLGRELSTNGAGVKCELMCMAYLALLLGKSSTLPRWSRLRSGGNTFAGPARFYTQTLCHRGSWFTAGRKP